MVSKSSAIRILNAALSTGGDYAEISAEESTSQSVRLENGKVETVSGGQSYGCGIRILKGIRGVYGYTNDLSEKSLTRLAKNLAASFDGKQEIEVKRVKKQKIKIINATKDPVDEVDTKEIVAYLKECYAITKEVDPRLVRIIDSMSAGKKHIELYTAEGEEAKLFHDEERRARLGMVAIAGDGVNIETSFAGPGKADGWHYFTEVLDYKAKAKEVGEKAVLMLGAKECPNGKFPVVVKNGWGGVLFHEACGHSLEAQATSRNLSVFSDCIGKQIASPLVTAYDDGTIPNEWGSSNIDSEGHPTQKNLLIKDGICVNFMIDRLNGRRLGMEANGTSRRQSYRFAPVSRMSNTYIAAGKDDPKEIIKDTKLGIYVADFGGGSVEPTTGEFNFAASEAYIIRDGKICEPVKGCTCIGTGREVLMNIDRVGNDCELGQGNCGASSGSVPVCVGQPTIRIKEITVGGRGGKLE